jgi:poly-gamma-glutamate synthesis protein (capsule biosynthesis protein)
MIHGGYEYDRDPSRRIEKYVSIAREAGASLIINHRPHVVSGFTWDASTLTAWSLGNFIYDQTVWPTFESYLLTVYIRDKQIVRAFIEPVILHEYLPHGLTGGLADYVSRGAAGRMPGRFVLEAGAMEIDVDRRAEPHTTVQALSGDPSTGTIYPVPDGQWVSAFEGSGRLRLGRDLLWVGSFEPEMVRDSPAGPLLWTQRESQLFSRDFAYQGTGGIRLTRSQTNRADAVTSHSNRVLVSEGTQLSITGMARPAPGALVALQVSWYSGITGLPSQQLLQAPPLESNNKWQSFRADVRVPPGVIAMGVAIRLSPPATGITTLDLDDLRLIEWADPQAKFGQLYTHILLKGEGQVSFQQDYLPLPP